MSLSLPGDYCLFCDEPADECQCRMCDDCLERPAAIGGKREAFCRRCREACDCCGEPVLIGARWCEACAVDLLSSNVLAPVRLASLELA